MLTYPKIDPVVFELGPVAVHWYGLTYLIGFMAAWWFAARRADKPDSGWNRDQVGDVIFYGAIGVIVGGRVGYGLFYGLEQWSEDLLWIFKLQQGGMSFHGGMLGVLASFWWFARKTGKTYFQVADFIVPMVPLGLASGRVGNFINAELWGRASDLPWAMVFPTDDKQIPRHPSMLYEAILEGVVLFAVLYLYSRKPRPAAAVTGLFGVGYGIGRTFVEFFREPDAHIGYLYGDWLTMGMLLSVPMIVVGAGMMIWAYRRGNA